MKHILTTSTLCILIFCSCTKYKNENAITKPVIVPLIISVDSIKVDPSGYNPLCALIHFITPFQGKAAIRVVGQDGPNSDIQHIFNDYGYTHNIPVIGLYPNFLNTVDVAILNNNNDTLAKTSVSIKTNPLPPGMPLSIIIDTVDYNNLESGLNLVSNFSTANPYIPLMIDNYGKIRWLLNYSTNDTLKTLYYNCGIAKLRNGNFFFGDDNSSIIYEVDLLGYILNRWDLKGYIFHHNVIEKPNGNFLATVTNPDSKRLNGKSTIEDYVIELDRRTGNIINTWDLKESLDENRQLLNFTAQDWIHVNALVYDSSDNTIIVSGRYQGVVKLTYDNHVKWILGPHKGWGTNRRGEDLNQFLLTPLDANGNPITDSNVVNGDKGRPDFDWNWGQHCIIQLPDGNMMMFDNGFDRNFQKTIKYSRALEFKIDAVNKTVQQVWAYGEDRGIDTYAAALSSVQYLPETNHILFCPGYFVINNHGLGGKILEIDYKTKKLVFQSSISTASGWAFHRVYRISAYP
jgi:arylsulfate sulfotransferase